MADAAERHGGILIGRDWTWHASRRWLRRDGDDGIIVLDAAPFHNRWTTRFDPVRSIYDMHRTSPDGTRRPIGTRSVVCMVPETERTTRSVAFVHVKVHRRRLGPLVPAIGKAAMALGWWEMRDDARFVRHVADTPVSMKGMRLGRFDRPLVHNRRLLDRIYWDRR